jgi:hypothetical protein
MLAERCRKPMLAPAASARYDGFIMQPHGDTPASKRGHNQNARPDLTRFRRWREQTLPRASYLITPRFWTPAGLASVQAQANSRRAALKSFEPLLTGLAHSPRRVHLAVATRTADYADVACLIHCRALMRDDPDYAEHRGKRVSMLILCDQAPPAVLDFAHRMRVRIMTASESPATISAPALPSADA